MSQVNISPNLFLEVNELNRLVKSLKDDGYKLLIKHLIASPGIAQDANNTYFKVTTDNTFNITINPGIAFDKNLDPIILEETLTLPITPTSSIYWVIIKRAITHDERGVVNVSSLGVLSGKGTEFTKVLRGQPNFPTKVKLSSKINTNEYEVVDVTSDTLATLTGDFVPEENLKYQVIGTFTPGFQPIEENRFIYEYDSCNVSLIESDTKPELGDDEYLIASITFNSADRLLVTDERYPYLFNNTKTSNNELIDKNSVAVLTQTRLIDKRRIQMFWEFGVRIKKYELITTSFDTILRLQIYKCHFLGDDTIPNDLFKGWLLINRANMISVPIDTNIGENLYISKFNSEVIKDKGNDFIIIPNYSEIEIEIKLSGASYEEIAEEPIYYKRLSLQNATAVTDVSFDYGETTFELKYRMIDKNENSTPFQKFNIAQFTNIKNEPETLGNSSFDISIEEPTVELRNYS